MLITGRLQAAPLPLPERQARAALGGGRVDVRVRGQRRAQADRLRGRSRSTVSGTAGSGSDTLGMMGEQMQAPKSCPHADSQRPSPGPTRRPWPLFPLDGGRVCYKTRRSVRP